MSKHLKIHAAWNEYSSIITKKETSLKEIEINDLLGSFFCPGPFYYYIFDFSTLSLSYIHPNVEEVLGLDPENMTVNDILNCIHPEDIPHMANGEKMALDFVIKGKPPAVRKKYKISYCIRFKTPSGNYKLFMQQAIALTLDEKGNIGKVLGVHSDISHITTTNNYKVSLIGLDGEPSFLNLDPLDFIEGIQPSKVPFSKRELEIIRLFAEGLSPKEIADKLFLSFGTVRKHQQNILSKSGCKNTIELVSKCIREGLI